MGNNDIEILKSEQASDATTPVDNKEDIQETITDNEPVAEKPFKVFQTEEDFSNFCKSTEGKAKGDLLKKMNLASVSEYTTLKTTLETERDSYKKESEDLKAQIETIKRDSIIKDLNINPAKTEDFLTLVRAKENSNNLDFKSAAEQVASEYGVFKLNDELKIGIDKSIKPEETKLNTELFKKYGINI